MPRLSSAFYRKSNVVQVAQELLGKVLCTSIGGMNSSGIICETEAYAGSTDKASHAYGNRRTKRTETMFLEGGHAYVYLCYGIHHLFNVVSNQADIPHAILIRGVIPLEGVEYMIRRRKKHKLSSKLCIGPGKVSQALGINTSHDAISLQSDQIWIEDRGLIPERNAIQIGPRIGIDYAEEDAALPYRFQCFEFEGEK
ncbi:MAG: DNA-3-methyladenine glycosylase [Vicingaceae bacterium]